MGARIRAFRKVGRDAKLKESVCYFRSTVALPEFGAVSSCSSPITVARLVELVAFESMLFFVHWQLCGVVGTLLGPPRVVWGTATDVKSVIHVL